MADKKPGGIQDAGYHVTLNGGSTQQRGGFDAVGAFRAAVAKLQAGRGAEAEGILRQILSIDPKHADAHHLLGVLALQYNRPADALVHFDRAVDVNARNGEFHANRAAALLALGRTEEGELALTKALARKRNHVQANYNMGLLRLSQNRLSDAERFIARAVKAEPRHINAINSWGVVLRQRKQFVKAAAKFRQVLKTVPHHPEALLNLANVTAEMGDLDGAVEKFEDLFDRHPDPVWVRIQMGVALARGERKDAAEAAYRTVLAAKPDSFEAHNNLGNLLVLQGRFDEAIRCFEKAAVINPNEPGILINIAATCFKRGDRDRAKSTCRALIENNPRHEKAYHVLYTSLEQEGLFDEARALTAHFVEQAPNSPVAALLAVSDRKREIGDVEIERLKRFANDEAVDLDVRKDIHFILGQKFSERTQWAEAFGAYKAGNALVNGTLDPCDDTDEARLQALLATFTPAFFETTAARGSDSTRPVFIVGMPRSGTTLSEQIIGSHADVAAGGELNAISKIADSLKDALEAGYPAGLTSLSREQMDGCTQTYLQRLEAISANARHVTDKMPDNYWHVGLIALLFPNARIIHCVRDPYATCLSIYFQNFNGFHPYAFDLYKIGRRYGRYLRLMEHWRNVLPVSILEVSYETMIADQEGVSRILLDFCGLDWDDSVLEFYKMDSVVKTASLWQVRQPIYNSSVELWRNYEAWLEPLRRGLAADT